MKKIFSNGDKIICINDKTPPFIRLTIGKIYIIEFPPEFQDTTSPIKQGIICVKDDDYKFVFCQSKLFKLLKNENRRFIPVNQRTSN